MAVTACPTGIAHTYMAAEALEAAAERAGVDIQVETQGSAGSTPLSHDAIAGGRAVIFAVDVGVRDRQRFAGKPVVSSGVKRPIDDGDAMIAEALRYADDPNAPRVEGEASAAEASSGGESFGHTARRVLMTGVSYMIPFVAAGGLLIALGFLFGGYEIANAGVASEVVVDSTIFNLPDPAALGLDHALFDSGFFAYVGGLFFVLGATAFKFLVPALAGYIAYAIADRPGIAPGFVMGALAIDLGGFGLPQSGFLGGIIGGVLAGIVALWISRWKVAPWARGLMPVLLIPLLATLITGVVMIAVLSKPLGWLMDQLNDGPDQHERERRDRHPARRRARPDDGLRHGRPSEQGRLLVRRRGSRSGGHGLRRRPRAEGDGRRDAGRHGAAAGPGPRDGPASRPVQRPRTRERQGRLGPGVVVHHRGGDPVRGGRPRPRHPVHHARQRRHRRPRDGHGRHPASPPRRHLRAVRRRQRDRAS